MNERADTGDWEELFCGCDGHIYKSDDKNDLSIFIADQMGQQCVFLYVVSEGDVMNQIIKKVNKGFLPLETPIYARLYEDGKGNGYRYSPTSITYRVYEDEDDGTIQGIYDVEFSQVNKELTEKESLECVSYEQLGIIYSIIRENF